MSPIIRMVIIAADLVEVAPRNGEVLTQFAAAQICHGIIAQHVKKSALSNLAAP